MVARAAPSSRSPDAIASALADATYARILAPAAGDAVAAAAILDAALDCPTQLRPLAPTADPIAVASEGDATDTTILLDDARTAQSPAKTSDSQAEPVDVRLSRRGSSAVAATAGADGPSSPAEPSALSRERPLSLLAGSVARTLGRDPSPLLELAGCVAAGERPETAAPELVERALEDGILDRQPGIATPTGDVADGLAHSTLLAGPFSGAPADATDWLEQIDSDGADESERRRVASALVCSLLADESAPKRAAVALERAIRPLILQAGPFHTVAGAGDVLDATARADPGLALTTALSLSGAVGSTPADDSSDRGHIERALSTWRAFGKTVHDADPPTLDGSIAISRTALPATYLPTVARLHRDFRTDAAVVAVTGDDAIAFASPPEGDIDGENAFASESPLANESTLDADGQLDVETAFEDNDSLLGASRLTDPLPGVVLVALSTSDPEPVLESVRTVIAE